MPRKAEAKRNQAVTRAAKTHAKLDVALEHEAILNDELKSFLEAVHNQNPRPSSKGSRAEGAVRSVPLLASRDKPSVVTGGRAVVKTAGTQTVEPNPSPKPPVVKNVEETPDDWEQWLEEEVTALKKEEGSEPVVFDVGAGDRGVAAAINYGLPMHCLCPVVLVQDLGRVLPSVRDTHVTVCSHRLCSCSCLDSCSRWLGMSRHSMYYLTADDYNRFECGDRLMVELNTYQYNSGHRNEGQYEVRGVVDPNTGIAHKIVKSWSRNKPWSAYYHVEMSSVVDGIRVRPGLYAYPRVRTWKGGVLKATFYFTSERMGSGEFDASSVLPPALAKSLFESAGLGSRAAVGNDAAKKELPPEPVEAMLGVHDKHATQPLSPEEPVSASFTTAPVADKSKDPDDEVRSAVRATLAGLELKGGHDMMATVYSSIQRRFKGKVPKDLATIISEELQGVREAQAVVVTAASREVPLVKVLNGEVPTFGSRVLTTLTGGEGKVVKEVKRRFKRPFQERQSMIRAAEAVDGRVVTQH